MDDSYLFSCFVAILNVNARSVTELQFSLLSE
jgi:hypothetical protein